MCATNVYNAFVCVYWLCCCWPPNSSIHKDCTIWLQWRKPRMNTQFNKQFGPFIRPHTRASEDPRSFAPWIPFVLPFFWHKPPPEPCLHSTGNNPLAKRAAISQPVKTGHILFCVGLTLSSPKLCSPLVTSQAWWNLYWCCLKGLELIHCFFLTAQFWIGPRCRSTGCPAGAELSCQYYPHCSF